MNWLSRVLSGGAGELIGQIGDVVDRFHLSGEEKQQFKLEIESLLQKRDSEIEETIRIELQAKERVLIAELAQDDKFTKRARPTVVYAGLAFIGFNFCIVPVFAKLFGADMQPLQLPKEFWYGWSGIVATWSIGRSAEKRGMRNRLTSAITGNEERRLLSDEEARG